MDAQIRGSLEENVLTLLCWNEDLCQALSGRLKPANFSTKPWQRIATLAIKHIETYKRPPGQHLRDLLETELRENKDELLAFTLNSMERLRLDIQPEFVLQELDKFLELRNLHHIINKSAEELERENIPAVYETLAEARPIPKKELGIWLSNPEQALRYMQNSSDSDFFSSGVSALDLLGVRPERKTLTVLLAETNKGKSWWAVQVGKYALMLRKSVLHITLEMSEEKTAQRYIQCLFGMTKNKSETVRTCLFRKDDMGYFLGDCDLADSLVESSSEENRATILKKLRILENKKLHIREFPGNTLTINGLRSYILYLYKVYDFLPDMLIVDYGDRMAINSRTNRIDIGANFVGLRGLGVEFDMAVISPTQGNRQSVGIRWVTRKQTGEDFSKVQTADTIITYSQTDREEPLNMGRLFVDKARDAPKGHRIWISQAYQIGQFCVDSVIMNEKATKELRRMSGED